MITTVLSGRVGNQLFQYAIARAAAIRLETDIQIYNAGTEGGCVYQLGLFKGVSVKSFCEQRPIAGVLWEGGEYRPDVVARISDSCVILGYWQSEKYFIDIESLIRDEFQPGQPPSAFTQNLDRQILAQGNKSVALSIRRGDYLIRPYHGVLPIEYYNNAMKLIASQVSNPHFFLFSDEPEWLKSNFKAPYDFTVVGNFEPTTPLKLGREDSQLHSMSLCQHAILANSSFSWWGAWLNPERYNRIVVAPKRWYLQGEVDTRDLLPKRWVTLESW